MFVIKIKPYETLHTKWGNAKFYNKGYMITSRKEGNMNKKLHRLIFEDFYNIILPLDVDIHHKDGNPKNNCVCNLEALTHKDHTKIHHIGLKHSEETKQKLSEMNKGNVMTENNKKALRKANLGNKYNYKNYPRIVKEGFINGKQLFALVNKGKRIKRSVNLEYLKNELKKLS